MYIQKEDYYSRISTDLLNQVIAEANNNGSQLLQTCSKMAEDIISTHAGVLYDLTDEFQKLANDRNHLIVMWALNIATYNLYQRIDDEEVPQKVIKNYDDTIEDLAEVSKGKYPLNLPAKQTTDPAGGGGETAETDGTGLRRIGSTTRRSHWM